MDHSEPMQLSNWSIISNSNHAQVSELGAKIGSPSGPHSTSDNIKHAQNSKVGTQAFGTMSQWTPWEEKYTEEVNPQWVRLGALLQGSSFNCRYPLRIQEKMKWKARQSLSQGGCYFSISAFLALGKINLCEATQLPHNPTTNPLLSNYRIAHSCSQNTFHGRQYCCKY